MSIKKLNAKAKWEVLKTELFKKIPITDNPYPIEYCQKKRIAINGPVISFKLSVYKIEKI
jgi:hypothetical protein